VYALPYIFILVMERLDYYDIMPAGMEAYLASHGHHFSKPMLEWAVSMMRSKSGSSEKVMDKAKFDNMMSVYGQTLIRKDGYYDGLYVLAMAKSDYFGSSITDEQHLAIYVKDYIDDVDGNPTRAFDEFYINCIAKGIDIPWEDMI
jgi:hypothetical protein